MFFKIYTKCKNWQITIKSVSLFKIFIHLRVLLYLLRLQLKNVESCFVFRICDLFKIIYTPCKGVKNTIQVFLIPCKLLFNQLCITSYMLLKNNNLYFQTKWTRKPIEKRSRRWGKICEISSTKSISRKWQAQQLAGKYMFNAEFLTLI